MLEDYYSGNEVRSKNADYTIVVGMRSNGKSYDFLKFVGDEYVLKHKQFVYIRKSDKEIRTSRVRQAMANLEKTIQKTYGAHLRIRVYSGLIQLHTDGEKDYQTMGYIMSNFAFQMYKSNSYPDVGYILFDEFTAKTDTFSELYGEDEVESFFQNVSTIIRERTDVKIFMLGNTINRENAFFKAFGINAYELKKGTISVYENESGLKIAVEYCRDYETAKRSAKFFTPSKNARMITSGEWEIEPHETSWNGNTAKAMLKWKSYKGKILIERDNSSYIISVPVRIDRPLIISEHDKNVQCQLKYMSLRVALSYAPIAKNLKRLILEGKYIMTSDKVAEMFFNDLRKIGVKA